ncbi:T9SS type A sorting domain-containing protein [Pontibacter sp. E15-1]|uniref:T9SS type A sorting domain-containing protein n=1 Tax=Pontibacter sp. E15-1 TaxID=2919918 RepID=UPI001F4FC497|nr:T9SS type A sorting domain-containing protein [Pontibacter sp. E15-1]MCJ8167660.1 T9SS type A sorting domain-containing protein [Pontibacter sp. E15-1]
MRLLFILFLILVSLKVYAQKEATNWYFGNKAGLSFSNGVPVPLTDGALVTESATAVISDKKTGKLLFYTNGRNIWNRQHQLMPGSKEFPKNCPSAISQPTLIVPVPGHEHLYYVFSVRFSPPADVYNCSFGYIIDAIVPEYNCEVRYSVVNMHLDDSMGDVVVTDNNILLQENVTEKITAVPHSNGRDFWLITHEWNSDAFYVYLISAAGLAKPAVQRIGSEHSSNLYDSRVSNSEIRGMMKASPDGKRLACAVDSEVERPFDLFDFNPATGMLSNYISLGKLEAQYGISFSPDNSKLYVSCLSPRGTAYKDVIRQYNLEAGSKEAIIGSGQSIIQGNQSTNIPPRDLGIGYYDLQIGLDGKIYGTSHHVYNNPNTQGDKTMLIIGKPNAPGFNCKVNHREFDLRNGNVALGLPNFIQSYFNGLDPVDAEPQACLVEAELYPNPTNSSVKVSLNGECMPTFNLKVVNAVGQNIMAEQIGLQTSAEVNLTKYADGLYLFILTFPNQQQVVKKVVKVSQ